MWLGRPLARRVLLFVVVTVAALSIASAASAAPVPFTSSEITTPADGSHPVLDLDAPGTIHVQGTTTGGDADNLADLLCYYGTTSRALATDVTVTGGVIDAVVPLTPLANDNPRPYCVLRAVPANDLTDYPPDMASPAFAGPHLGPAGKKLFKVGVAGINQDLVADYWIGGAQSRGYMEYDSAGGCGVDWSFVFDPITFAQSDEFYYCAGWLNVRNGCVHADVSAICVEATRSDLMIDGKHAFLPASARYAFSADPSHAAGTLPGYPQLSVSSFFDPLSGDAHISESDQTVVCSPNPTAFHSAHNDPAWPTDCSSFAPAGVKVERMVTGDNEGRRSTFVDVWSSTDGKSHQVDALYDEEFKGDAGTIPSPSFDYSWDSSGFIGPHAGDTVNGPASDAPATMLVDGNGATPDVFQFPQGAVTFSNAPVAVHWYRAGTSVAYGDARFVFTVPREGSVTLAHSYLQGSAQSEISAQIAGEQARVGRPHVAVTSPAEDATVDNPAVTVTGTASDPAGGLTGLTVNGDAVTVAGDGSWSKPMTLALGENKITAVGTDTSGNTTTVISHVTYTPPSPPADGGSVNPPPAGATADKVAPLVGLTIARTKLAALLRKGLPVSARCSEPCSFTITLVLDRKTGRRVGLAAASLIVGRGSGRLTAPGTKKVVVKLSKRAAKKLRKTRSLRLTVKLTARDSAGNVATRSKKIAVRR